MHTPDQLPAALTPPDYQHSLANLAARLHGTTGSPALQHPLLDGLEQAETIVLLLIDGMGEAQLAALAPDGWLARQPRDTLRSVFPSTTTAAITTLLTGAAPSQHGLLSWHIWAPEAGCIATPLPLREHWRGNGEALADEALAAALYRQPSALIAGARKPYVLQPAYIADSHYSRHHGGAAEALPWHGYDALFSQLAALAQRPGRKFVYAYIPDLDSLMHHKGTRHARAQQLLQRLDKHCAALAGQLPASARLLITADHGQLDIPPEKLLFINDYPELAAMLARPLSGEPRVAFCQVRPECHTAFPAAVAATLGHALWILKAEDVLAADWFGPGPYHPQLAARLGDFVLLMKDDWGLLQMVDDKERPKLIGNHGGMSAAEMLVPLIVYTGMAPAP
ncbi:alkaline phosphatase family protein [Vogesella oryzae]|uniref:alkaline phosphatase family protein n=1 Tax=Vogesella oryzae TaxID=1735285 RepID=UPI0015814D8B|nr:alkaline phosphatase family protein [Vogesella oryzae]